ncbi:Mrp/NBP35 family ATP-binding protein [uncultured Thermanaerothrix sp.]|uniref:Mrp/NBP35 family ATP-binding protein n=1 Tax=uncultured Thermanaerothrix sp. TaxID=1195149 RepID=UPI00261D10BA|nr:Mrp/NBP35 family ATP-binding protein [uncultured Thermanaerothrix sp.]
MPMDETILREVLRQVIDPELGRNIVDLGMVRDMSIEVEEGRVRFTLALTTATCPLRHRLAEEARAALLRLPGVNEVEVVLGVMSEEERRAALGTAAPQPPKLTGFNRIGQVIAVVSGKGGVGKSSLTALLAVALRRQGQKVGILDADITGPSIPKLFGLPAGGLRGNETGILPAITRTGIRVVSANLMLPTEDAAVAWRGPLITGLIQQFWGQVLWGQLDTLLVDLPPGTSDPLLTVARQMPLKGAVLVTSPQQLTALVVRKAVNLLKNLNVPVLGVVENLAYYPCPQTGEPHEIFGPSHAAEVAEAAECKVVVRLPIRPELTMLGDAGRIEEVDLPELAPLLAYVGATVSQPAA